MEAALLRVVNKSFGFILLCAIIVYSTPVFAQSNFLRTYNLIGFQDVNSIIEVENHNYVLVGEGQNEADGLVYSFVVKTDANGNIVWKKYFESSNIYNTGNQVINTAKGYVILANGFQPTFYMLATSGNILTKYIETDISGYAASMDLRSEDSLIVAVEKPQPNSLMNDVMLLKTDLRGVPSWAKVYGDSTEDERPFKVIQLNDGGSLVLGTTTEFSEYPYYENILVFRTDILGEVLWKQVIGGGEQNIPSDLVTTLDGNFLIASYNNEAPSLLELFKIDENGTILWDKFVNGSMSGVPKGMTQTTEGDLFIVGERLIPYIIPPEPPRSTIMWKISQNGDLLWEKEFIIDPHYSSGYVIITTSDGNLLAGGRVTNGTDVDFFLMKIGTDGCQIDGPSLGKDSVWCNGPITLDAGNGYKTYQWSTGETSQKIEVSSSGIYSVKISTIDFCNRNDTIQVAIKDCFLYDHCRNIALDENDVRIPNIITPNGDGKNDTFEIPKALVDSKIAIYNRWGSQVYFSDHFDNSWDGAGLADGIYYYILSNECIDKILKGPLTITR